jgi:nucleoside-diphosphate-sugar epimerase
MASPQPAPAEPRQRGLCAVSGASGYVGSRIANHLADVGWAVRALCRTQPGAGSPHLSHVPFELTTGAPPDALEGVDTLVHAAYDFSHTRWSDIARVNIAGSRLLFTAAQEAGVDRIVCISTVAAFPGTRSMYGRAKLEIERLAMEIGATVIRPGLVWGPQGAAILGALQAAVERLPVVPLVAPPRLELTLVHEHDLALLVERLIDGWPEAGERLFVAAAGNTLTFVSLLRSLAAEVGERRYFLPVPWRLAWLGLRALETVGVTPPFRSDSLLSLVHTDSDPLARATGRAERYGVTFRAFSLP